MRQLAGFSGSAHAEALVERRALDGSLLHGVAWTAGAKWLAQGSMWIAWLVVARLLSPADYGLVGMAAVYLGLITLLSEFGLGTAVLAVRDLTEAQLDQLNGLSVLLGLGSMLVSWAAAVPLGRFFDAPELPLVVVAMSTTFLITSFKTVPLALLQRDLRFRDLALIDLGQALVLAVGMVALAAAGLRYWTLVGGAVLSALLSTAAVLRLRSRALVWPRPGALKSAMTLSFDVVMARLCWYASTSADALVAGRFLGPAALGLYNVGATLANVAIQRVAALVGQVTPAYFAAVQDDRAAVRRYVLRITEGLALITFPASVGLALVARDLVLVLLGPKWAGAIAPLQLLAAYATVRSITPLLPQVLMMMRDSRFEVWRMLAAALVLPPCFYFGAERWGVAGLATAWVVVDPVFLLVLYRRVFARIELSASEYLRALRPALNGTAVMAGAVITAGALCGTDADSAVRLATQVAAGVVAYALACRLLHWGRLVAFRELMASARLGRARIGE
ncbi:MAG TPA: lipopolysaccharide biosynthesis protein [Gemmatimonadales bacterium]|nr:lipopolysaccharide biosynthesis protein [Gemmatimonadales bacterium]